MKIICEFDSMEEFEAFRVSGKKTRSKREEAEQEAVAEPNPPVVASPSVAPQQQTFTPPVTPVQHGFPGANGQTPPVHPLVTAILARIDGAVASGQQTDAIVNWFRQQIGPEAAQATLDQIKQVFVPRMTEAQLKQIAPQLGIQG